jgi:hypothetical protein
VISSAVSVASRRRGTRSFTGLDAIGRPEVT